MSHWNAGYVTEVTYPYTYHQELNPCHTKLALLRAGILPGENGMHCELGVGQGLSTNFHAAGSGSTWYANDFNSSHARQAQALASASGAKAFFTDESFVDFCARPDLPEFDSIALHGVWTWISNENRSIIVDFVRRKLKVGGLLYISYNTQHAWAPIIPLRNLLTEHTRVYGNSNSAMSTRIVESLNYATRLMAINPAYAETFPELKNHLQEMDSQDPGYLAHEYFNQDWLPMSFTEVSQWLEPAKLHYACSANYGKHVDVVNMSADQQEFLEKIDYLPFRETVRDFIVSESFRTDYWIKGPLQLGRLERAIALRQQQVVLVQPSEDVQLTIVIGDRKTALEEKIYKPIISLLADHKPRTLQEILDQTQEHGLTFPKLMDALFVLIGKGSVLPTQPEGMIANAKTNTDRLNTYLISRAVYMHQICHLASPVTGGGIPVDHCQLLFLLSMQRDRSSRAQMVQTAFDVLAGTDYKLRRGKEFLVAKNDIFNELNIRAEFFEQKLLPILKALQIIAS